LILCTSLDQLRRVIKLLNKWSSTNNLLLNAKKSGIIEFLPRIGKQEPSLQIGNFFKGIPIVEKYKYLGLWINSKLNIKDHITHIKQKAEFQTIKLWPLLKNTSLDFRMNLWTILIRPLFEMLTCLYKNENSRSNREMIVRLLRVAFKKFALLKKNVSKYMVEKLMNFDFEKRAEEVFKINQIKWEARKLNQLPAFPKSRKEPTHKRCYYPKELQQILNLKTALCPQCKVPCSSQHMNSSHQIFIPNDEELLDLLDRVNANNKERKRGEILDEAAQAILPFLNALSKHLNDSVQTEKS